MSQGQFYHRDSEICTFRPVENISKFSFTFSGFSSTLHISSLSMPPPEEPASWECHEAFDSEFSHLRLASETISKCH